MSTSVKASHPIGFTLLNNDEHPILDVVDDGEGRDLKLEITNSSGRDLKLADIAGGATEASEAKHHFELRFRPGVLSDNPPVTLAGGDWVIGRQPQPDRTVSLYLLSKSAGALRAGASLILKLQHVSAQGGARGTRVELKYRNLQYVSSDPTPKALVDGHGEQHLSIVNQRGHKYIPLHVGIVGSNKILNDGSTPNTLILRITNLLKPMEGNITLNASSKFILTCDVSVSPEHLELPVEVTEEWALATSGQAKEIVPVKPTGWHLGSNLQGDAPVWTISPLAEILLKPSTFVDVTLTNIITSQFSGQTNLYVHYEDIPGYWDGDFVCVIEKGPVVYKEQNKKQNVGIGTSDPRQKLEVAGNIQLGVRSKLFYQGDPDTNHFGSLAFHTCDGGKSAIVIPCNAAGEYLPDSSVNLGGFGAFDSNKVSLAVSGNVGISNKLSVTGNADFSGNVGISNKLSVTGNVGIGTTDPQAKLSVTSAADVAALRLTDATNYTLDIGSGGNGVALIIGRQGSRLAFGTNDSEKMRIDLNGNVGIGTHDPKNKLDVNGDVAIQGKHAIRGNDGWLRLNQDRAFPQGIHTPHLLTSMSLNVGGINGWGDPGAGNVSVTGRVGIGTKSPDVPLDVKGSNRFDLGGGFWFAFLNEQRNARDGSHFNEISIKASNGIQSETSFFVTSDLRIKKDLKESDPLTDLDILGQLQVTDYKHIDFVHHGDKDKKGLIAQQVEQVFPQAVSKQTDVVPDIYTPASFADGWVELATDLKKGERVRLISEKGEGIYEVLEAATDKFRTDFNPEGDKVFVFGREVDDFRSLDYDAISVLNVSATQQLKKEKDEEVKLLRAEITDLKSANDALQQRLILLESKFEIASSVVVAKNGSNGNGTH